MREICIPKLPFKRLHHPFTKNLQLFEPLYHLFTENLQSSNSCAIHSQKFFSRLIAAHLFVHKPLTLVYSQMAYPFATKHSNKHSVLHRDKRSSIDCLKKG